MGVKNRPFFNAVAYTVLSLCLGFTLIYVVLLFTISIKSREQTSLQPLMPTLPAHWENYETAWTLGLKRFVVNSFVLSVTSVIGELFFSAIVGYVFARYRFPGKDALYNSILIMLMVPWVVKLIPLYVTISDLGLVNTNLGYILPYVLNANVFLIMVFRTHFASLSEEMFESARIDGAGHWTLFSKIAVPLSWSVIGAMSVLQFSFHWGQDIFWPLLVLAREELRPISVGLLLLSGNRYAQPLGVQMAGSVIAAVPMIILFFVAMRAFMQGLTTGALKM